MKKFWIGALVMLIGAAQAEQKFFAFDNGLGGVESVEEQAILLKKLGYDGICSRPGKCTPELLAACAARGIGQAYVTLHVGLGTFRPVTVERVEDHRMHAEWGEIGAEAAAAINDARARLNVHHIVFDQRGSKHNAGVHVAAG